MKTNAMRILDQKKITYKVNEYDISDGRIDGISVAEKTGADPAKVFKTLVTQGTSKNYYVFVIPVLDELDLKEAARVSGEKKIEMIPMKDLLKITGYIKGGCSPIGMKKNFKTFIHKSSMEHETIMVSGGKQGLQIELAPGELKGTLPFSALYPQG
ncbi:MAG: Cys-tRNA(Pro) deacylase [Clostridia bacterium]|nr:Cys-tRNA(Pro) deacylase [Clostridia bacterium]